MRSSQAGHGAHGAILGAWLLGCCAAAAGAGEWNLEGDLRDAPAGLAAAAGDAAGRRLGESSMALALQQRALQQAPAPGFKLNRLQDGGEIRFAPESNLAATRRRIHRDGKAVLLYFWGDPSWCPACSDSMDQVESWHQELGSQGLRVIGVAVNTPKARALDVVSSPAAADGRRDWRFSHHLAHDDGKVASSYGVVAVPAFVLISPEGRIILRRQGKPGPEIRQAIRSLLQP